MSYLNKNFRALRKETRLSQDEFAQLFGLNRDNINSYEKSTSPKLDTYLKIMAFYKLDPFRFFELDMEKHSVKREAAIDAIQSERLSELESWLENEPSEKAATENMDQLSAVELKAFCHKQIQAKKQLLKENLLLKDQHMLLMEKYTKLLEYTKKDEN